MIRRPPRSTLFPYTTLFRSLHDAIEGVAAVAIEQEPFLLFGARHAHEPFGIGEMAGHLTNAEWLMSIDRKSTRLNSSHDQISYAVFCLKKKNQHQPQRILNT